MASDFDERIDAVPKSDPNVVTALARNAQAQGVVELVKGDPEVFGPQARIKAYRRLLEVLRVQDIDSIIPPDGEPLPIDIAKAEAQAQQAAAAAQEQPAQGAMPPTVDPVAADVARKDAQAGAKIEATRADIVRKDAEAQARIEREAAQMQGSPQAQREGDQAIVAQDAADEMTAEAQAILEDAMARRMQLAQQGGLPEAPA